VTQGAVSGWLKRAAAEGAEALRSRPIPGAPKQLSVEQRAQLPEVLKRGAEAFGFRGDIRTRSRVKEVIRQEFGVSYSLAHVGRLLKQIGWSLQKPRRRARQRDEAKVTAFKEERWPALKKNAIAEDRTVVFVDQSGFYLLPMAVRTRAPVGETPALLETLTRDHLSVMAGVTPEGKLFTQTQEAAFNGSRVVHFLQHLLRQIEGKLLVLWDGAPIHKCKEVKAFLSEGAAKRLHLEMFPGYSPDLNPQEGVWSYLKRVELKNLCCHDLSELKRELKKAIGRLRHKVNILQACVRQPGLY
jgi:transposase